MKCKECGKEYPSNSSLKTETLCKTCYEQLKPEDQSNSAMQLPELPNPSELIKRAFQNAEVSTVSGIYSGGVRLTPTDVERMGSLAKHFKPTFNDERCRVMVDVRSTPIPLVTQKWELTSGKAVTTGIYEGGLKFPKFCCTCMEPAARYQLVEVGKKKHSPRAAFPTDKKTATRLSQAISDDRFWYAIPYCSEHDLSSGSVSFDEEKPFQIQIEFLNRDFAKQFCEKNGLDGRWLAGSTLIARNVGIFGIFGGFFAFSIGGVRFISYFKNNESSISMPLGVCLFGGGLLLFLGSLIYWLRNRKGVQV